jgi:hypothetical protein
MGGIAKAQVGADAEAVLWMRRGLDANRNFSLAHFDLAAVLVRLGSWTKRGPQCKRALRSIRASPFAAIVTPPTHGATFRLSLPGATATLRACGRRGCLRGNVRQFGPWMHV